MNLVPSGKINNVLQYYNLGLEAEKHMLLMFRWCDYEEKNIVAEYLLKKGKIGSLPSMKKLAKHRRKELINHQHRAMKDYYNMHITAQ
jgi:hypothetical protein